MAKKDCPLMFKIELEKEAMKDLVAKLKIAGIEIPFSAIGLKFVGEKGILAMGIQRDVYENVLRAVLGYFMWGKGMVDLAKSISVIKKPIITFNGVRIAGGK